MGEVDQFRPFHDFLITPDGELRSVAYDLPEIRNEIQNLPETAASFDTPDVLSNPQARTEPIIFEFCKAWPMREEYGPTGSRERYVNPNYIHAHRYSDLMVECECGATFVRNYEDDQSPMDGESAHREQCLPHWRLRARAEMSEKRYNMIRRLGWLGWKGMQMGHRFGVTENHCGSYARDYGITLRGAYDNYRRAAGKTSAYLITFTDADLELMAEVYGHSTKSIRDWMKQHTAYQPSAGGGWENDDSEIAVPEKVGADTEPPHFRWNPEAQSFETS